MWAIVTICSESCTVHELAERIRASLPDCRLIAISDSGAVNCKTRLDETAIAAEVPIALVATLRQLAKRK